MHQPSVGCDDLTDLECMATIPSRDSSAALVKAEAILANLEQRFKKDQIYVSFISLYLHSSLEHTCWLRFPKGGEGFLRSIVVGALGKILNECMSSCTKGTFIRKPSRCEKE